MKGVTTLRTSYLLLGVALILGACASSQPRPALADASSTATAGFVPAADATRLPESCGATPAYQGSIPAALVSAAANNAPKVPYVIAQPPTAAAFIFSVPLHAGAAPSSGNKVIWVTATEYSTLEIEGTLPGATPVHYTVPALWQAIHPSVDVPTPGCWHFTVRWSGQSSAIDIAYR